MTAIEHQQVGPRLSQACTCGPTVYLAASRDDPAADATGKTEQILRQIDRLLKGETTSAAV
jgi:hypothetical protein